MIFTIFIEENVSFSYTTPSEYTFFYNRNNCK